MALCGLSSWCTLAGLCACRVLPTLCRELLDECLGAVARAHNGGVRLACEDMDGVLHGAVLTRAAVSARGCQGRDEREYDQILVTNLVL